MAGVRYETELLSSGNNTGIEVPPDLLAELGGGKRPAVSVTVSGPSVTDFSYSSTVASMGGKYLISFSSEKRAATGLAGGDPITVELTLDAVPRTVQLPADLAAALAAAPSAQAAWERLAPSARKAHVMAVESAKAAATRERRVAKIAADLAG
ncbi:YdeI/OmpD-associated family protein [Nakamurella sp. A5-74]|uniref:YdeI/OmpD-associated family protein n=1 Tax=Nakamurella sp. A5-74 TaxID=3158264 RepID=A0AAU8DUY0_9ACTN